MKKIYLFIVISLLLFGCEKTSFKINDTITIKGTINNEEVIDNGTYHKISVIELQKPIIIEGIEITKLELDTTDELIGEVELTGIIIDESISGLSYSLKTKTTK